MPPVQASKKLQRHAQYCKSSWRYFAHLHQLLSFQLQTLPLVLRKSYGDLPNCLWQTHSDVDHKRLSETVSLFTVCSSIGLLRLERPDCFPRQSANPDDSAHDEQRARNPCEKPGNGPATVVWLDITVVMFV